MADVLSGGHDDHGPLYLIRARRGTLMVGLDELRIIGDKADSEAVRSATFWEAEYRRLWAYHHETPGPAAGSG